jgi:hypothetical protein
LIAHLLQTSLDLVEAIPALHRAPSVHEFSDSSSGKALGVCWNFQRDVFSFSLADFSEVHEGVLTRRAMLRLTASIYDPLGLVLPWVIRGKLLLRRATQLQLGWDEQAPEELKAAWAAWLDTLRSVATVVFPRCIKPKISEPGYCELHVFCDASELAYGCCVYMRCVGINGRIVVSLIAAKSFVAPLKQQTIPRLELQAASKAVTLASSVRKEIGVEVTHFWTDSMIVIGYISNDSRRFRTFVANRVGHIRSLSKPTDWRHVSSRDNPADILSRPQCAVDRAVVVAWSDVAA